jgi:hypothetical protein
MDKQCSNPTYKIVRRKNGTYAVEATGRLNDPPTAFGSFGTEAEAKTWIEEHKGNDASSKP